ncbi:DNA-directed RNA polymerases I, II, and III subunit RPABC3 [Schizosaccharomyces pombe]|uniref:DNA-directed RNA polymerases I, II, and III subunit RPABC3 n=1 Tax=Schizosaccharomyces pombe (strain 972 / ATCC 24843) TaxID=284812 RepID=RPAB3_SCHPO|nr:DNA-directed RNA polymerase subunit Rpb8 [Schizosaccharomyces pombe]Q92399.2 RecName: Full=DNA-directed RNA polymerases I, II, and III subunit RPABC3; Short=RNA polymerases I, II, and III subunit ABC3; AltName: Full=DNA-directed RNA polymerases I, II, and III 14.5 kDa polypeptide; AltName: Full=RPC14 [Schizosaccharomyces pombe 972h-]3H0G_H Chain H, DNA-directed RNA polymerases I, II, and III subunit RPABC3 [Schizosaccharomyces pombe 972h-]3H0G_T Chain T, DNA-directed RNA polymerases I, II, an|eukprot:NP_595915.1 DNA-directed RNA polymerase subunit Rpb8 [Schizosaccharomyces pombe]
MSESVLLDEIFTVTSVDKQKYQRVSRITAVSGQNDMNLTLDINSQIYPLEKDATFSLQITSNLNSPDLKEAADYIMYGKVYRVEEAKDEKVSVYVSFGGLLMAIEGSHRKLYRLSLDHVYLLLRR